MSSEEHIAETEPTDEQRVLDQERADEEREASFLALAATTSGTPADSINASQSPHRTLPHQADAQTSQPSSSRTASPTKPVKGRKSRVSGAVAQEAEPTTTAAATVPTPPPAKKPRVSFDPTTSHVDPPEQAPNVRLDRLRQALGRFLDLIDYKASASNIAKSLPHIEKDVVTALRTQFVEQLKEAIKDENEKLIAENDLDLKLQELHELTQEADQRYHDGLKSGSQELKDTWRSDLDIQTAISARAIPEQEHRIAQLKHELDQVHQQNDALHRELRQVVGQTESIKSEAKEALDSLDSVSREYYPTNPCTQLTVIFLSPRLSKAWRQLPTFRISYGRPWTIYCRISVHGSNLSLSTRESCPTWVWGCVVCPH